MFDKLIYTDLHHLAVGRIAEYWTKLVLTLHGLDIYTSEVDNKGIDFVVRGSVGYFDIQVKSVRYPSTSYAYITKEGEWRDGKLRDNLYLALVLVRDFHSPTLYIIPSTAWLIEGAILKNKTYGNELKSKPEWGINLSERNMHLLAEFEMNAQIDKMK